MIDDGTATVEPLRLRPHYPCLEGLRTLGVMALFFQHTGFSTGLQNRQFTIGGHQIRLFGWMGHLEWGPGMFFVLSAFLLYQPFAIAAFTDGTPPRWWRFLKARLLRVIPAYWLAITLLILFFRAPSTDCFGSGVKVFGLRDGIEVYTLTQVYDWPNFAHGITAAYTLNTELVFYLLVPLFGAWLARASRGKDLDARLRLQLGALGGLSLIAVAWRQVIYAPVRTTAELMAGDPQFDELLCQPHPDAWRLAAARWFPGYLDYFCLGAAVAAIVIWAGIREQPPRWLVRIGDHPQLLWSAMLGVFALYSQRYGTYGLETVGVGAFQIRYYLVAMICLLMLLPGVTGDPNQGIVRSFLRWRPIAYTGLVSYGVYLWHQGWTDKVIEWTAGAPFRSRPFQSNFVLVTGVAVALSLLSATLSWRWWEQPINRRRDVPLRDWLRPIRAESGKKS